MPGSKWWKCPVCGCDHFLSGKELVLEGSGPYCSRCLLNRRKTLLTKSRWVPLHVKRAGRTEGKDALPRKVRDAERVAAGLPDYLLKLLEDDQ